MTPGQHNLLLSFFGDDFTGSTDALEILSCAGAKTVLFIEPPTVSQLERYSGLQAIGVAGMTRAMAPEGMERTLRPAFASLKLLGAPHVHYKVCSTFDSSPTIGSIGKAMDIGAEIFRHRFIPLLVAAPALGRYCAFGNLFARMGIGSGGNIYRLDRHPSMTSHPVTPADESDLRLHLARQTSKKVGLVDILQIAATKDGVKKALEALIADGAEVVLFDALYEAQLQQIGEMLDDCAGMSQPLFSVGSSGIEMALGNHWKSKGKLQPRQNWTALKNDAPLLVASGSCSPVTAGQIAWAVAQGFVEVALDIEPFTGDGTGSSPGCEVENVISLLREGRSVIVHTSRGANDERVARINDSFARKGFDQAKIPTETAQLVGNALGNLVRNVAEQTTLQRVILAGGDTSSFAARAIGIEAVEMIAPLSPGAPLCRAYAPHSPVDGVEVAFKGGQVGREDFFGMALEGRSVSG